MEGSSKVTGGLVWGANETPLSKPLLRGIHHLVFNTDDLPTTLDFYCRVLGMPIVGILTTPVSGGKDPSVVGNPKFGGIPHIFLDMGNDSLLAFFEFPRGKATKADRDAVGGMQHCSFFCSPSLFREMHERLLRNNVKVVWGPGVAMPPNQQSIYFYDPNGIRLEFVANVDFSGNEQNDPGVVHYLDYKNEQIRGELEKVSKDAAWLDSIMMYVRDHEDRKV